jgi:enterochelin esterase family protein
MLASLTRRLPRFPNRALAGLAMAACGASLTAAHAQTPSVAASTAAPLSSQTPARVVSPEVHPDRTVTFRILAPTASAVSVTADWQTGAQPMEKADNGVWSLTVGPLAPAIYIYSYTVDGIAMADPGNPRVKLRSRGSASLVEVPADPPALWQLRDVPHGDVATVWQKSAVLNGETRSMVIYTPPGYEQDPARRYPVLYLLHGSNDTQFGWTAVGQVNFLLDNLVAANQAVPMIIVMPNGYAIPYGKPGNNTALLERYLLQDVIPMVDAKYRTIADREHRGVAGMSMGAEESLAIFFNHLDEFNSVGALCPSGFRALETQYPALLGDAPGTNAKIAVFWLGCGREDPTHFPGSQRIDEVLTAHQINHIWHPTEGVHNYAIWQLYMEEFLPLLFHGTAPAGVPAKSG